LKVRFDRIARIQEAMREQGWIAIVIVNHDDYRYLFGTDRSLPPRRPSGRSVAATKWVSNSGSTPPPS
jgi:fructoselysine-6-P-deglycase FrlB-like protein